MKRRIWKTGSKDQISLLHIVSSRQQWNQEGVSMKGEGWFNLAPFSRSPVGVSS